MAIHEPDVPQQADTLLTELRGLIEQARAHVAQTANATLTMLYLSLIHIFLDRETYLLAQAGWTPPLKSATVR